MQPRETLEKKLGMQPSPSPSQHYKMNPPFSSTQVSENQIFLLSSAFATTNLPMPPVNFSFFLPTIMKKYWAYLRVIMYDTRFLTRW